MKKRLLQVVLVLIVLAVVVVAGALMWVDRLARSAVEHGATFALGVPTTLASADVAVMAGAFSMSGLNVANSPKFQTSHFLALDSGQVAVTLKSLMRDTVELPKLALDGMDINIEKQDKQANYEIILANLARLGSDDQAKEEGGKQFVIRQVVLTNVTVHAQLPGLGMQTIKLPEIRLQNVGSDTDNGVMMSRLTGIIIKAVLQTLVKNAADVLPSAVLGSLDKSLAGLGNLGEVGVEIVGQVGEQVGKVGKELKGTVGDVSKSVGDVGEKLQDGLGGLLQKKNKKKKK